MRIDDENKVVWCSEELLNVTGVHLGVGFNGVTKLLKISEFAGSFGVPERHQNRAWKELSNGIFNEYEFKLEQPKEYYWRKKKEYLAWFEDVNFRYLNNHKPTESILLTNIDNLKSFTVKFTEQEARDLLKDDFDKFDKVECE